MPTLYERLIAAGCEVSSHRSDLYVRRCEDVLSVINAYMKETGEKITFSTFKNNIDGGMWLDIPFSFDPYWAKKQG